MSRILLCTLLSLFAVLRSSAQEAIHRIILVNKAIALPKPLTPPGTKLINLSELDRLPATDSSSFCPDPKVIPINEEVILISFNSSWWLMATPELDPEADCNCKTKNDVLNTLRETLYQNRNKTILFSIRHPLYDYSVDKGHYTWKDHLFPLTALNRHFYLPLPGIGSLIPFYHEVFTSPTEMNHPLYKEMIRNLRALFKDFPNVIFISTNGEGQKLIQSPDSTYLQIIIGSASKHSAIRSEKNTLYKHDKSGYILADIAKEQAIDWRFFSSADTLSDFRYSWKAKRMLASAIDTQQVSIEDSMTLAAHPAYAHHAFYTFFMGKNYRKEWAMPIPLPVLKLSNLYGGLHPIRLGGGLQSTSLRLVDSAGLEYALRSVEKKPDLIVPKPFEGTIVRDILDDVISSQHPYSALVVPPIAEATGIPHSNPIIGIVAPDTSLGMFESLFTGKVALLENREPLGKSDSYIKAFKNLQKDHENSYDAENFMKARMVDLFLGDWDRHADQWRFYDQNQHKKGAPKYYLVVPRDRDMVFYVTQGVFPTLIKRYFAIPRIYGFNADISKGTKYYLYKSDFLQAHPASQLDYLTYKRLSEEVKDALTDSVLERALQGLPKEIYTLRHDKQLQMLQSRREGLPKALDNYYQFINKIIDIRLSDKTERVLIHDVPGSDALKITVIKTGKKGKDQDTLFSKIYPKTITKEIRLYLSDGNDAVTIDNKSSGVKLRIIGGKGNKSYEVLASKKPIEVYDRKDERYSGKETKLKKHIDHHKENTAFAPVNLYNLTEPLLTMALNPDDGFFLGAGFRHTHQEGFRKAPYASRHELMISHSFATQAFNVRYHAEWLQLFGKTDLLFNAHVQAPDNTQNFFGIGNETPFNKVGDFKHFYRTRFDYMELNSALRWRNKQQLSFSIGPAFQYYHLNELENEGRFILQNDRIGSYDSLVIGQDKLHYGLMANLIVDKRNNPVLPSWGTYLAVKVQAYSGLNTYSRSYAQLLPQFAFYKAINAKQNLIFSDRLGGGITLGKPAFYQEIFLGSDNALMGFRKYRFAGQHAFYNNAELRIALTDFGNYIVKGQLGLFYFYDIGRVWQPGEHSTKWHQGTGPGVFMAPANLAILRFSYGYTEEGWYPNFAMGWRF